jgi:archaellum component FlaC
MADEPDNVVLEHLRHIRAKVDRIDQRAGMVELRLSTVESHMIGLIRAETDHYANLEQLNRRVERLERHLELGSVT